MLMVSLISRSPFEKTGIMLISLASSATSTS